MKYCELMIRDYSVIPSGIGSSGITSSSSSSANRTSSTRNNTSSNTNNNDGCNSYLNIVVGIIALLFTAGWFAFLFGSYLR